MFIGGEIMTTTMDKTLKKETIDIIKSTVPVLEKYGEQITKRFYHLMFSNHPELLNIFNHAHQKQGRQPRALAQAVYSAAKYIDQLETILPVVKQIGHKHRSLGVKPEHYPIVGKHLLLAIKDVLGEAATEEIISAWEEAYGVIADVFIKVEKEMYEEVLNEPGGWEDFRPFSVVKKVKESTNITSFYLKPMNQNIIKSFLPGQYISVKVKIPGEDYTHIRQYSLSDSPLNDYYRISVKREEGTGLHPAGKVSNYLHDHIQEGDTLDISAPAGDFTVDLNVSTPVIFISGGVGITPLLSMVKTVVHKQPNRQIHYIHAAINGQVHAFDKEIKELVKNHENFSYGICYQNPTESDKQHPYFIKEGYIDTELLRKVIPAEKSPQVYFCGPVPFMKNIYRSLMELGIEEAQIFYEFFGPSGSLKE